MSVLRPSTSERAKYRVRIIDREGNHSHGKNSATFTLQSDYGSPEKVKELLVRALSYTESMDELLGTVHSLKDEENIVGVFDERLERLADKATYEEEARYAYDVVRDLREEVLGNDS